MFAYEVEICRGTQYNTLQVLNSEDSDWETEEWKGNLLSILDTLADT